MLVALLGTTFGPTAAIRALTADATLVAVADIDSMIQAATGETVRAFGASLHHAIVVVETARDAYTRSTFVTELRDAIAEAAGYDPADAAAAADIDTFVTRAILSGDALGALNRSGEPITRGEAGELVAAGLGFRPANLQSVLDHDADGARLMEPLQGAPHPDAYLSRLDAREIMTRIRRVDPRHLYRAVEVLVETETGGRVPRDKAGRFLVRAGTRLRWVATTDGSAWRAAAADITISLVNGAGTRQTVTLQQAHARTHREARFGHLSQAASRCRPSWPSSASAIRAPAIAPWRAPALLSSCCSDESRGQTGFLTRKSEVLARARRGAGRNRESPETTRNTPPSQIRPRLDENVHGCCHDDRGARTLGTGWHKLPVRAPTTTAAVSTVWGTSSAWPLQVRVGTRLAVRRPMVNRVAWGLTVILIVGVAFWQRRLVGDFRVDDAYITFSFSKNLAQGLGPVYSSGLRVEGYSNFLWMLAVSLGYLVMPEGDPYVWARALSSLR